MRWPILDGAESFAGNRMNEIPTEYGTLVRQGGWPTTRIVEAACSRGSKIS